MLVAEGGLRHALRRLPGRKILYSNAPLDYIEAILGLLRVGVLFDAVYSVEHTRFRPKPDPAGLRQLLEAEQLLPSRAILVEDTLANLRTAKRLGLKTVWVSRERRVPAYVDRRVGSVLELPRLAGRLGAAG